MLYIQNISDFILELTFVSGYNLKNIFIIHKNIITITCQTILLKSGV